jgi:glycosyltransferase involved in cell wall biosynthesis
VSNPKRKFQFSVLMAVYAKETAGFLQHALASLAEQTLAADEVLIVKDGPLGGDLEATIAAAAEILPIRTLQLARNSGLGLALQAGVPDCRHEFIARMDSDDICAPDRFQKQVSYLLQHPEVDVLGGSIAEFEADGTSLLAVRRLARGGSTLRDAAKRRNPMNHMTVMFRKSAVLAAGNYQPVAGFEDYFLWARMLLAGFVFANLDDVLAYARCGNGMQARRGGLDYAREEIRFEYRLRKLGFLSWRDYFLNIMMRIPLRLAPTSFRAGFYRRILRHRPETSM